jgi:hypothetical protein
MLIGKEGGFVGDEGGKSLVVGVERREVQAPFIFYVRLTLLLPIEVLILLLPFLVLVLVIFIIGTLSNKMTELTALEV